MKEEKEKQYYIHVLVTKELKEQLTKEAEIRQLAIASYIRQILLDRKKPENQ